MVGSGERFYCENLDPVRIHLAEYDVSRYLILLVYKKAQSPNQHTFK